MTVLETLINWDFAAFKTINRTWSNALFDALMPVLRNQKTWYPLYVIILTGAVVKFKFKSIPFILIAVLTIVLSDQISSSIIKPYFGRLRPCTEPLLQGIVQLRIGHCPGSNGSFTSSHATNHFALAVLFFTAMKPYVRNWSYLFFVWAASICYAQVYVGVHFPGDVIGGTILGLLIGIFTSWLFKRYFNFEHLWFSHKQN